MNQSDTFRSKIKIIIESIQHTLYAALLAQDQNGQNIKRWCSRKILSVVTMINKMINWARNVSRIIFEMKVFWRAEPASIYYVEDWPRFRLSARREKNPKNNWILQKMLVVDLKGLTDQQDTELLNCVEALLSFTTYNAQRWFYWEINGKTFRMGLIN